MSNNKGLFPEDTKTNNRLKPFIITFAVFILVLSVCSIFLFMYSLDFDINNLVESTTEVEETTTEVTQPVYSIDSLTGDSNILFIVTDSENKVKSAFCTLINFDNKTFNVKQLNGDSQYLYGEKYKSINGIFQDSQENGLAEFFTEKYNINVDKFVVFKLSDLRRFLALFNGVTVNVAEDVNYKSNDYNLELSKGKQEISGEKALNYFLICDNAERENVICDIIASILTEEHVGNAEKLFKNFANLSKTDISVMDFYNSLEVVETYCYADDKFLPQPYSNGDKS
jgi:anionic cell wall polymer biosynthesis LytR-Cps2A-Psr (LCP) family protein